MNLLLTAAENLAHRVWLQGWSWRQLGWSRPHARVSYALALDALRGPAHRAWQAIRRTGALSEADLVYGETPVASAELMLRLAEFPGGGRLLEVGCGRAPLCLVAAATRSASAQGWEVVPSLAARARWLARALDFPGVQIHQGAAGLEPLPDADLVYLACTTWSEENLARVVSQLGQVTCAISLSRPLPSSQWRVVRQQRLPFSWGWSEVFWSHRA